MTECCVCLESISEKHACTLHCCANQIHTECLANCIANNLLTCPLCKQRMVTKSCTPAAPTQRAIHVAPAPMAHEDELRHRWAWAGTTVCAFAGSMAVLVLLAFQFEGSWK